MTMKITREMKDEGARILLDELGSQFTPYWVKLDDLAEQIFLSMYSLAVIPPPPEPPKPKRFMKGG